MFQAVIQVITEKAIGIRVYPRGLNTKPFVVWIPKSIIEIFSVYDDKGEGWEDPALSELVAGYNINFQVPVWFQEQNYRVFESLV